MRKSFLLMVLLVCATVFIYIWQQNMSTRLAYRASALRADYDKINSENDILRLKISSILALEKIDKIAKEKNLTRPDEKRLICID